MTENYILYKGDCLEEMNNIPDKSVDMILCDLPYGTTACSWDVVIPFEPLWNQYKRVIKDNGCIALFGSEPFSSYLRLSNIEWYKYDLYWVKEKPTNFFQLKKRFGKLTEIISIFYKNQPTYNPQMKKHEGKLVSNSPKGKHKSIISGIAKEVLPYKDSGYRFPNDLLYFNRVKLGATLHPTQKPITILEYLIKTFTNENDTVLDNTMGSGSTGIACLNTNRKFIGIEKEKEYFQIAENRINNYDKENNKENYDWVF